MLNVMTIEALLQGGGGGALQSSCHVGGTAPRSMVAGRRCEERRAAARMAGSDTHTARLAERWL